MPDFTPERIAELRKMYDQYDKASGCRLFPRLPMFREDKATAMAVFFLGKEPAHFMNDVKLMKLLYIAERRAAQLHGVPITQDSYSSMFHGPVLLGTYRKMAGKPKVSLWAEHLSIVGAHKGDQYLRTLSARS